MDKIAWSLIANHIKIEDWASFPLICKKSYAGFKFLMHSRTQSKLCLKCGNKTIRHDQQQHEHDDDQILGTGLYCWSLHENDNEVWYICESCETYHHECPNCLTYCKLNAFPCVTNNKKQLKIIVVDGRNVFRPTNNDDDDDCVDLPEEWKMYYIDNTKWCPTGGDGGLDHRWACETCNYKQSFSDK